MKDLGLLLGTLLAFHLLGCAPANLAAVNSHVALSSKINRDVIYGDDNRLDLYDVAELETLLIAQSTVALINSSRVYFSDKSSKAVITGQNFGQRYNLCPEEPFREQDIAAFCSGFLVTPNTIVTAGHCIRSESDCNRTLFVFDFALDAPSTRPLETSKEKVYSCKQVVHSQAEVGGADFAVVTLDRPVVDRPPLPMASSSKTKAATELIVVGHPSGLPTKVASGAQVREDKEGYYVAYLDTYQVNSGSAVFNAKTHEVMGVLVRGETDFTFKGNCRVSRVCENDQCRGEDVTKISEVFDYLPE